MNEVNPTIGNRRPWLLGLLIELADDTNRVDREVLRSRYAERFGYLGNNSAAKQKVTAPQRPRQRTRTGGAAARAEWRDARMSIRVDPGSHGRRSSTYLKTDLAALEDAGVLRRHSSDDVVEVVDWSLVTQLITGQP